MEEKYEEQTRDYINLDRDSTLSVILGHEPTHDKFYPALIDYCRLVKEIGPQVELVKDDNLYVVRVKRA